MLDRKFILQNPDLVAENSARRGVQVDVPAICELETQRRAALQKSQEFNTQANETSKRIASAKDADERNALIAAGRELRDQKDAAAAKQSELEARIVELQSILPNLTHPAVPDGGEEDAKELGFGKITQPTFDFKPIDHLALGEKHDLFDFEGGARVAGSGFYFLRNAAVRLDLALQQFAISFLADRGFTPVATPDLALTSVLQGTGFNPRGPETQIYSIENTELNLIATAEIPLGGMLSGQIIESEQLPIKLCGLSHCFRTEAGAAGRASRGLYRVHQFSKIEMFAFTVPEQSDSVHEEMRELECEMFDALEVPYRVVDTAAGDLGGPAYRKYDLEAWMPGRGDGGEWGEVTSTSNCTDYQARRLDVRYKTPGQKGTQYVHTLNGTAVATGRAMIAILENHQRADGSITIPKILQPWVGQDVLEPIA
ncbi:serine--tRNA ligase [Allorhodopirellula solitaria]|uniref:Serine--tRNA ligase n=1 Tax=Allorhodopirellula solitaria TaxID=2527987 RepID=A0A5C5YE06_9BACT|nr:serine--tRNA ligase [Allorhodopirellula solitaria]TWT73274.1 Serine--tRNA ligase [Allorhodopirellula solitaria]